MESRRTGHFPCGRGLRTPETWSSPRAWRHFLLLESLLFCPRDRMIVLRDSRQECGRRTLWRKLPCTLGCSLSALHGAAWSDSRGWQWGASLLGWGPLSLWPAPSYQLLAGPGPLPSAVLKLTPKTWPSSPWDPLREREGTTHPITPATGHPGLTAPRGSVCSGLVGIPLPT